MASGKNKKKSQKADRSGDGKAQSPATADDGSSKGTSRGVTPDPAGPTTFRQQDTGGDGGAVRPVEPLPTSATPSLLADAKGDDGLFAPPQGGDRTEKRKVEDFIDSPSVTKAVKHESSNDDFENGFLASLLKGTPVTEDNNTTITVDDHAIATHGDPAPVDPSPRGETYAEALKYETATGAEEDTAAPKEVTTTSADDNSAPENDTVLAGGNAVLSSLPALSTASSVLVKRDDSKYHLMREGNRIHFARADVLGSERFVDEYPTRDGVAFDVFQPDDPRLLDDNGKPFCVSLVPFRVISSNAKGTFGGVQDHYANERGEVLTEVPEGYFVVSEDGNAARGGTEDKSIAPADPITKDDTTALENPAFTYAEPDAPDASTKYIAKLEAKLRASEERAHKLEGQVPARNAASNQAAELEASNTRVEDLEKKSQVSEKLRQKLDAAVSAEADKNVQISTELETSNKRVQQLENKLQRSEYERQKLDTLTKELRERFTRAQGNFEYADDMRKRELQKYEMKSEDRDKEATELWRRIKALEDDLVQERARHAQTRSPTHSQAGSQPPTPTRDGIQRLQEDLEDMTNRERKLAQSLKAERRKSAGLKRQLSQGLPVADDMLEGKMRWQVRALLAELQKTRAALGDSQRSFRLVRAQNNRLAVRQFSGARQLLAHYGRLLDPRSQLYETLHAIAAYRDGTGGAPTFDQQEEFRTFREYLDERARVLHEAMEVRDPRKLLKEFDDRWAEEALKGDWGATITLRLSATRAATALRYQADVEARLQELTAQYEIARARRGSLSSAEKVFEFQDELQYARPAAPATTEP